MYLETKPALHGLAHEPLSKSRATEATTCWRCAGAMKSLPADSQSFRMGWSPREAASSKTWDRELSFCVSQ